MKTPCEADEVIKLLNGRWFAKKKVSAETWDGKTKYEIEESEAERDKRLKKWGSFLESDKKDGSKSENMDTEVNKNIASESESTKLHTSSESACGQMKSGSGSPESKMQPQASTDSTDSLVNTSVEMEEVTGEKGDKSSEVSICNDKSAISQNEEDKNG